MPLPILGIALGEQLSALDKILENIAGMETRVAELNSLVTSLGKYLRSFNRKINFADGKVLL